MQTYQSLGTLMRQIGRSH